MPKPGSKKRPIVVTVQTQERAEEVGSICDQHHWYFIAGIEPHKPEDVTDLEKALHPPLPVLAEKAPGRNDPCPCGSGRKYKKCCGITG